MPVMFGSIHVEAFAMQEKGRVCKTVKKSQVLPAKKMKIINVVTFS